MAGIQPNSNGLQPKSDCLQPNSIILGLVKAALCHSVSQATSGWSAWPSQQFALRHWASLRVFQPPRLRLAFYSSRSPHPGRSSTCLKERKKESRKTGKGKKTRNGSKWAKKTNQQSELGEPIFITCGRLASKTLGPKALGILNLRRRAKGVYTGFFYLLIAMVSNLVRNMCFFYTFRQLLYVPPFILFLP